MREGRIFAVEYLCVDLLSPTLSNVVRVADSENDEKVRAGLSKCHRIKVEDRGRGSGCQHRA